MNTCTLNTDNLNPELSAITKRLQSRGMDELTALFMRVRPHLRKMVEMRLDRRLHARVDASDIVQETFVRASRGLEAYIQEPKMDPVTWLRLVSKHLIAEVHRHHFRTKRSPDREQNYDQDCSDLLVNRIAQSMQSVGSAFNRIELLERVRLAMNQLSCNDREIIEMRHVDQMSIEEAAQFLEITFEAAKKRYQRALTRFRELTSHFK